MDTKDEYRVYGTFSARVIDAFGPIIKASRSHPSSRFYDGCVFAYPMDEGALVIATDGVVMAAVQDRSARLSAPVQLMLPDYLIDACAPPAPIRIMHGGWSEDRDLPEWAQPHSLTIFALGGFVSPKMPYPVDDDEYADDGVLATVGAETGNVYSGRDYRAKEPRFDPRHVFKSIKGDGGPATIDPQFIGHFGRARRILNAKGVTTFQTHAPEAPISVHFSECPDFLGLIMPTSTAPSVKLPPFATTVAAEPA